MTEKIKCAGQVRIPGRWMGFRPCIRPAKNHEDGKDWCAQHTPSLVSARHTERTARWNAEWVAKEQARAHTKVLDAARAAVVEAAKAFDDDPCFKTDLALRQAAKALKKMERPDA